MYVHTVHYILGITCGEPSKRPVDQLEGSGDEKHQMWISNHQCDTHEHHGKSIYQLSSLSHKF